MNTLSNLLMIGLIAFCLAGSPADAHDPTQRELELEKTVQDLLRRVAELEKRLDMQPPSDAPPSRPAVAPEPAVQQAETAAQHPVPEDSNRIHASWNNGLRFETSDGSNRLNIGGRIHNDWYAGSIDDGDFPDGTRFRRLRFNLDGIMYDDFEFKMQYDIAGDGASVFRDVYLGYTGLDFANIRIGQFREPFSLEELISNNYITLMERAPINMFVPSYETGLMLHRGLFDDRMTWAAGIFKNVDNFGDGEEDDDENGDWDIAARLTGLPWYENNGSRLLHLGLAGVHREWSDNPFRLRTRGSFSRGNRLIDTGEFEVDTVDQLGAELALVYSSVSLQAEYMFADVEETLGGSSEMDGFYVEASYFLTGEHRPYKNGVFTRVKPTNPFSLSGAGWGAWQVTARYTHADLTETPVLTAPGGRLDDYAVGLNWYLNPNMRVMWNYVHSESDDTTTGDQDADVVQMRLQLDF